MFAHSGPLRDPLLDKIGPAQINRTLELRATKEQNEHALRIKQQESYDRLTGHCLLFLGFVMLVVMGLCWLFLAYGKTDQVINLLALLFTGGGGVGIGYGLRRNRRGLPAAQNESSPVE
jgi:hypothetical protein